MTTLTALLASAIIMTTALSLPDYKRPITVTETRHKHHYHDHWKTKTVTRTASPTCSKAAQPSKMPTDLWPGWEGITHMFTFGDSYTTTGFNHTLAQPSLANPLGNPDYPGYTATNGPNWVDFLTTTHNATFLQTINLASGGATVDSTLVQPYQPTVLSLTEQIQTLYLPNYSSSPDYFVWRPDSTLFATFIGINDIGNSYYNANSTLYTQIFTSYALQIDALYQSGGRNFLFLNVPPVDLSPLTVEQGAEAQALEAGVVASWNQNVTVLARNLSSTYADARVFVFDTHALFTRVLEEPCEWVETCGYRNLTGFCKACEFLPCSFFPLVVL